MAYDPAFRTEVEEKLEAALPVTSRAMFGGVGLYAEGRMFALIADAKLYLKVSDHNRADFEAAGMEPFYPYDSPTPMGYWELPPGVLDQPEALLIWATKAVEVASAAASRSRSPRPRRR